MELMNGCYNAEAGAGNRSHYRQIEPVTNPKRYQWLHNGRTTAGFSEPSLAMACGKSLQKHTVILDVLDTIMDELVSAKIFATMGQK